jgi:hypothetical protein
MPNSVLHFDLSQCADVGIAILRYYLEVRQDSQLDSVAAVELYSHFKVKSPQDLEQAIALFRKTWGEGGSGNISNALQAIVEHLGIMGAE